MGESILAMMNTDTDTFTKKPLVGPANVSKSIVRNGGHSVFVGKMSSDRFGTRIIKSLKHENIYHELDLSEKQTAVAFVFPNAPAHSILFYRNDSADIHLDFEDIQTVHFKEHDVLYMTSFGFVEEGSTQATHFHAINKCKLAGGLMCFDISYYETLWNYENYAKEVFLEVISLADIVRLTHTDCQWLTDFENLEFGMRCLQTKNQIIIAVSDSYKLAILDQHSNYFEMETHSRSFFTNKDAYANLIASFLMLINIENTTLDRISSQTTLKILDKSLMASHEDVK